MIQKQRPNIITHVRFQHLILSSVINQDVFQKLVATVFSKNIKKINPSHLKRTVKTVQREWEISLPNGSWKGTKSSAHVFYLQAAFI